MHFQNSYTSLWLLVSIIQPIQTNHMITVLFEDISGERNKQTSTNYGKNWNEKDFTCFSGYFGADIKETASMWPKSTS